MNVDKVLREAWEGRHPCCLWMSGVGLAEGKIWKSFPEAVMFYLGPEGWARFSCAEMAGKDVSNKNLKAGKHLSE